MAQSVAVVVDSTASLPPALVAEQEMVVVPYYVHLGGQAHRDMVEITPADLEGYLAQIADPARMPKTANPGPGDYERAFLESARRASTILSFHMTSIGSGAYQAACVARDGLTDRLRGVTIRPIDTANVAMAHGWIALQAARVANAGADLPTVLDVVTRLKESARMLQTADTLRYLYLGGRIGRAKHLMGSLLHVRPLVTMERGEIETLGVARTRAGALKKMADLVARGAAAGQGMRLALTHFAAEDEARQLGGMIRGKVDVVEELICELSPALCVHSGPGTVGLCYVPDLGV